MANLEKQVVAAESAERSRDRSSLLKVSSLQIVESATETPRRCIRSTGILVALILIVVLGTGCSLKRIAVNSVGDLLAAGDSVYERDDDLILVGAALPFSLKLVESMLSESPNHRGLLITASRGYVLYAYAYVHFEADRTAVEDLDRALVHRQRARRLYLRAHDFAVRALEVAYPGFATRLGEDPERAVSSVLREDAQEAVPPLYWAAAALGLAISVSQNNAALLARLPEVEAMLDRALALDEAWNAGTLHEFQVTWAAARRGYPNEEKIQRHYQRALELSGGSRASLYLAYAEAVSIPKQDKAEFQELLDKTLAIDIDAHPNYRLLNVLAQRRAMWLKSRTLELFF